MSGQWPSLRQGQGGIRTRMWARGEMYRLYPVARVNAGLQERERLGVETGEPPKSRVPS